MKRITHGTRSLLFTAITALALSLGATYAQQEGTAKGGGQKLMQAKQLKTSQDISTVKDGDIVTSTCPKCKTTSYKRMDTAKGGAAALETRKGQCPACEAKTTASGDMKHTCKMCNGEVICCVIPGKETDAVKGK